MTLIKQIIKNGRIQYKQVDDICSEKLKEHQGEARSVSSQKDEENKCWACGDDLENNRGRGSLCIDCSLRG